MMRMIKNIPRKENIFRIGMAQNFLTMKWLKEIKCIEMERNGFLPSNVNCVSFPLTQSGEKIIVDYIIQMAMKGYYEPNYQ